jgi:hypothetical protein
MRKEMRTVKSEVEKGRTLERKMIMVKVKFKLVATETSRCFIYFMKSTFSTLAIN